MFEYIQDISLSRKLHYNSDEEGDIRTKSWKIHPIGDTIQKNHLPERFIVASTTTNKSKLML